MLMKPSLLKPSQLPAEQIKAISEQGSHFISNRRIKFRLDAIELIELNSFDFVRLSIITECSIRYLGVNQY